MTLSRFALSGVRRVLTKYGISDRSLEEELVAFCFEVRTRQLDPQRQPTVWWDLPAIKLVKEITGQRVEQIMAPEICAALGDEPDEQLVTEVYRAWVKLGKVRYEPWGWLDYVKRREVPQGRGYAGSHRHNQPGHGAGGSGDAHRGVEPGGSAISRKLTEN